jgi:hypothetical protein
MKTRIASLRRWLALGLLLLPVANAQSTRVPATSVGATIELHGCEASAGEFDIQATATQAVDPASVAADDPTGVAIAARVITTGRDRRHFSFTIDGLEPGQAYLLGAHFAGRSCPNVFWRGLDPVRVYPGQTLEIHGYAARTRVEVLGAGVGRGRPVWLGADHLDFADPKAAVRRLRVASDVPDVSEVVLQVAAEPFSVGGREAENGCLQDDGAIRVLRLPARPGTGWVDLPNIDFHALLQPAPGHSATGSVPGSAEPIDTGSMKMLQMGAPLYVRAIAVSVDPDGNPRRHCSDSLDGVSGWVKFAKLPVKVHGRGPPELPTKNLRLYSVVYKGPEFHPWPGPNHQYCVRAVQAHPIPDMPPPGWFLFDSHANDFVHAKGSKWSWGGMIQVGDGICYGKSSGSSSNMLSVAGGLVTGFVDAVGDAVNDAAALWETVKKAVVKIAAGVISAVGVPCDATCQSLLTTGLNIALASAGIPPSLPNMQQIKQQGIEYVAAQVADQSPVPGTGVLVEHALNYAVNALEEYGKHGGGGGLPPWLAMDVGLTPATLTVRVERVQTGVDPTLRYFNFYPASNLLLAESKVFDGQAVSLPRRFWRPGVWPVPGAPDLLTVPLVLTPNLSKVPPLPGPEWTHSDYWQAVWDKQHWQEALAKNPCTGFMQHWLPIPTPPSLPTPRLLGLLATRVYTIADFNAPLPDPAFRNYCGP